MIASKDPAGGRLPPITLARSIMDRLSGLALAIEHRQPDVAAYLERELDRANVVEDGRLPPKVVTIGSCVQFQEEDTGTLHQATLCWPAEEDVAAQRVSVLTPVGAALIGLREGQSIAWQNRFGTWRHLRIVSVT